MTIKKAVLALFLSATLAAPLARADENTGFQLALRTGYTLPFGNAAANAPLSDLFSGIIPFQVDAGWRFTPNVMVGAFFQFGLGLLSSKACDAGASCSGNDLVAGVQAHYHFAPQEKADPWAGLGVGYEWANFSQSGNNGSSNGELTFRGFQFVNIQAGVDFPISSGFRLAPFVQLAIGQYSTGTVSSGGQTGSGDITNTALHELLTFGVRGSINL